MPPSAIAYYLGRGNVSSLPQNVPVQPLSPDPVRELQEKVRAATLAGRVNFLPYLDPYTEETMLMRRMYPIMLRHPVVKQALATKVNSVAALDLQTVPAAETDRDHEIADFVRYSYSDALEGGFPGLAEEILLPGLIYKSSIAELVWFTDLWKRGRWIGKRFFRAAKAKEYAQLVQDEYRNIVGVRAMGFGQAETFSPEDFAIFINFRLFHGAGMSDLRAAYNELWQLDTVEKMHLIHLEKFLSPVLSASYSPDFDIVSNKASLEADLAAVRARGWLLVPDAVKVQALQLAVRGEAEMMDFKRDKREQIALSIAGAFLQMLTAGSNQDIRGDSQTQQSTSELLVWALASKLTGILNTQITPRLVNENYAGADYPKVTLGGINYGELAKSIEIDEAAQRMGSKLSSRAFARKYNLQLATDQADELQPPQQQTPQLPNMTGMFGDDDQDDDDRKRIGNLNGMLMGQQGFRDRRRTRRFCGGKGGKPGPCPEGGGSDGASIADDVQADPKARSLAGRVYDRVAAAARSAYLSELPKWALDTANDWLMEDTMNAQGGPGSVLMVKAAAFGASRALMAAKKLARGFDDGDHDTQDIAVRLRAVLAHASRASGGALTVPSVGELRARLDAAQGDSRGFAARRGRRRGVHRVVAKRPPVTFAEHDVSGEPRDASGQWTAGGGGGGGAKFVGQKVGKAEHEHAAGVEQSIAKAIGGEWEEDNKPWDVKKGKDAVEVKSFLKGKKQAISMHPDAVVRKADHAEATGSRFHTVAVDERENYEGGAHADNYSGNRYYYKRGAGRYALSQMQPVKDLAELNKLIKAKDEDLPAAARGSLPTGKRLKDLRSLAEKTHQFRIQQNRKRRARAKA